MDLRQLRYFVTVAEELHFGRAAGRLHMTQPPLSQAIQALESEIGTRLFSRTKRTVALTPVGKAWLAHVRGALEAADALPGIAQRLSRGELGSLKLAFISIADYNVLPPLLSQYRTQYPGVQVHLREATSDLQIESLLAGEIDAGLILPPAALHISCDYLPLFREPLMAAVPVAWKGSARFKALAAEPLILFPRPSAPAFHDLITGYFVQRGVIPRIGQEAVQMQTILSLVSAGLGVALVPRSMVNLGRTGVRYLPLEGEAPEIETGLVWRRDDASPALRRFIEVARSVAGEGTAKSPRRAKLSPERRVPVRRP